MRPNPSHQCLGSVRLLYRQAGTGPSRRHIQGSKIAKGLPSVNLQYSKIEKPKNGPSGAPGPASASPWRAKEKKMSHNAEKLKGGPFGVFQHPFCRKTSKNIEGRTLWEKIQKKSRSAEKN